MAPSKGSTFSSWSRGQSSGCSSESETWQLPYFKIETATAEALPLRSEADTETVNPVPQRESIVPVRLVKDEGVPVVIMNSD